jgi:hypothetical protein
VLEDGLARNERLHHHLLNAPPARVEVLALVRHPLAQARERPLGAFVAVLAVLVEHEVLVGLVHRVVGEVHAHVVEVVGGGRLVQLRAEAHQPLLVEEHAQRVARHHQHVDPQIELHAVDEVRLGQVPLRHAVGCLLQHSGGPLGVLRPRTRN